MDKKIIKQELFYFFSAAVLSGICLEIFWPRIILAYFNLNFLFIAWLVSAVLLLKKAD